MNRNHERQEAESDRRHLAHKKSQLTELKDQMLTGAIGYKAFQKAAYPLQKAIKEMEPEVL